MPSTFLNFQPQPYCGKHLSCSVISSNRKELSFVRKEDRAQGNASLPSAARISWFSAAPFSRFPPFFLSFFFPFDFCSESCTRFVSWPLQLQFAAQGKTLMHLVPNFASFVLSLFLPFSGCTRCQTTEYGSRVEVACFFGRCAANWPLSPFQSACPLCCFCCCCC